VNDVYLNGRLAADFEIPAIEHARKCERDRNLEQLAGLIAGVRLEPQGVPLPRQAPELKARKRTITDLSLDVLS
jgi:hypothetical protein